ncbi:MAG: pyruvate, phosphate dikinase [Candidatus Promineifilaceae bacterium]|nr:pyruvate, phosphate dikinase [Candidatus Promineifilaceae bacterium]
MLYENREHKWVYLFEEGRAEMKVLLGGKGANVAEMARVGLPVPPGFTITTEACNAYLDYERQFPEGMWSQSRAALTHVEEATGRRFGDPANPLLVSVRSGAAVSMPGMMDTVLNLGLNDETVEGLAQLSGSRRFALDAYRRFISMFGSIVMGVDAAKFERVVARFPAGAGQGEGSRSEEQLEQIIDAHKRIIFAERHGELFPQDVEEQLRMAIAAVFDSWNGRRAIDYRRVHRIPDNLGTAVNVQAMVFGNRGWDSGTGVAFTRNPATGERQIFGEYLLNAQGEDVVAGIRTPEPIERLREELPAVYEQLEQITSQLEAHYKDMQDIEFTVEEGKLWMLQTRTGKRTGAAAVHIAVEMVEEGLIDRETAVLRVTAEQVEQLLHPTVSPDAEVEILTSGLPASPGAAAGRVVLNPDDAEAMAAEGESVILVRHETSPDDFHGMVAAEAILTARGGMTSHAAVVARGMGKPCIVGAEAIRIEEDEGYFYVDGEEVRRGEWITLDGATGNILRGKVPTEQPELGEQFHTLMAWADAVRRLGVRANADTGEDAATAREFGAEGIGLCRTEHMFFGEERLAIVREMILAPDLAARKAALARLLPIQRQDFLDIFRAMDGLPVTVRLLDPPLHEFLPRHDELQAELYELKLQMQQVRSFAQMDQLVREVNEKQRLLQQVVQLREVNPMLGHRGCRLGLVYPEVTEMQTRAIFEAASRAQGEGVDVQVEVMIPLVSLGVELAQQAALVRATAEAVTGAHGMTVPYTVGTMIELPRAALRAGELAQHAEFFSFGTNDLTQTTFGLSRDDGARFLSHYIAEKYLTEDPFQVLDQSGVGELVQIGVERGRAARPGLKIGICGEHGGEPRSIAFCHEIGLDYVSCSSFRVPVARLAAAQAALRERTQRDTKGDSSMIAQGVADEEVLAEASD